MWADRFSRSTLSVIINSHLYRTYVPTSFREHVSDYEMGYVFLQQNGATVHTGKINHAPSKFINVNFNAFN